MFEDSFRWDPFSDALLLEFVRTAGPPLTDPQAARRWLRNASPLPDDHFVKRHRRPIESIWLTDQPLIARRIVDRLSRENRVPIANPQTDADHLELIRRCKDVKAFRRVLLEELLAFGRSDGRSAPKSAEEARSEHVPSYVRLDLSKQSGDPRTPHPYQLEAWKALDRVWKDRHDDDGFRGLLVMPTGSGKTYSAVRWLAERVLSQGGRVLWLAHRFDLLEQAADAFHRLAGHIVGRERLNVRIVSGSHHPSTRIGPTDDVIVASVQSLRHRWDITSELLQDKNLFVVVDEAHHAVAPTYRRIITALEGRSTPIRLLGLTATPTRTSEDDSRFLSRLFGNRVIYEVTTRELIDRGFLARPIPASIRTGFLADDPTRLSVQERRHLARFSDLSESWQRRFVQSLDRNRLIVRCFADRRNVYGKTLVFAIDVEHAVLLVDEFAHAGIRAEYLTSHRADRREIDRSELIRRFRDPNSGLDVLVNVQILTEGVDLPEVRTVMLARPTRSETLLRQMIGRAMRGPKVAGGTEIAHIVSFEDEWVEFDDWLRPLELLPELEPFVLAEEPEPETVDLPPRKKKREVAQAFPWALLREIVDGVRRLRDPQPLDVFEAVPIGWLLLEPSDESVDYQQIFVFEHQQSCWQALVDDLWSESTASPRSIGNEEHYLQEYFEDCSDPQPSRFDLTRLLEHRQAGGEKPTFVSYDARHEIDPDRVAKRIIEEGLDAKARSELVTRTYEHPLARQLYPTRREFDTAVSQATDDRLHPHDSERERKGTVVFEPWDDAPLPFSTPFHDLDTCFQRMLEQGRKLLAAPSLAKLVEKATDAPFDASRMDGHGIDVDWTTRPLRSLFGKAWWNLPSGRFRKRIRINTLLDSPLVPVSVIEFLLWHEYLHILLRATHTRTFRKLERSWPTCVDSDRFLDTLNERHDCWTW